MWAITDSAAFSANTATRRSAAVGGGAGQVGDPVGGVRDLGRPTTRRRGKTTRAPSRPRGGDRCTGVTGSLPSS